MPISLAVLLQHCTSSRPTRIVYVCAFSFSFFLSGPQLPPIYVIIISSEAQQSSSNATFVRSEFDFKCNEILDARRPSIARHQSKRTNGVKGAAAAAAAVDGTGREISNYRRKKKKPNHFTVIALNVFYYKPPSICRTQHSITCYCIIHPYLCWDCEHPSMTSRLLNYYCYYISHC